ncbi:MAG TPA: type II secretion system F family protein [Candidatus Hydrogenedentes bacterium]|nr:type II secretion system F family protein [Candidatus Hydrogenedentota bacterium]
MGLLSSKISLKSMVPMCRQLATSYDAGIPILRALSLVKESAQDKNTREVILNISTRVQNGWTLGDAARAENKKLPLYFIELLAAGEKSGSLAVMLRDLANYFEDQLVMRRQIITAAVYPVFQLSVAWFFGTFALRLVRSLDFTGKKVFSLSTYFHEYMMFQLKAMIVLAMIGAIIVVLSRMGIFQWIWGWFTNFVWPIKNVTRKFALARFFRSMSLLIGSGMHIRQCIENSAAITVNPYIQRDLLKAAPLVADGATLVDAFAFSHSLTPMARQMLHVGEQSGNLEQTLLKVSEYHLAEANTAVKVATRAMNVLLLIAIGGLVGYIYISFWTTYYGRMLDSIG